MLLLSRLIGQQVSTPDGRTVGRLADLTVRLGGDGNSHLVHRLVVRLPTGAVDCCRGTPSSISIVGRWSPPPPPPQPRIVSCDWNTMRSSSSATS